MEVRLEESSAHKTLVREIPVTHVVLKDGRTGVIRDSRTSIKMCKKMGWPVEFIDDNQEFRTKIGAENIKSFLNISNG